MLWTFKLVLTYAAYKNPVMIAVTLPLIFASLAVGKDGTLNPIGVTIAKINMIRLVRDGHKDPFCSMI